MTRLTAPPLAVLFDVVLAKTTCANSSTTEDIAIDTNAWGYSHGPGWQWGHGGYGCGAYGGGPLSTTTTIRKHLGH